VQQLWCLEQHWSCGGIRHSALVLSNGVVQNRNTQVQERERIARELHDTLLQGFQGVALQVQGVAKS